MTPASERPAKRLQRGTLSRGLVVQTALQILDDEGPTGLTFQRLGQQLSASSTSVYRHFTNREEIMVALADELDRISLDGYVPHEDWTESLRDLAFRAWRTALDHPAAAALCMTRTTRGIHELRAVDAVLEALHRGGWRGRAAVEHYQVLSNFILAMSSHNAWRVVSLRFEGQSQEWVQEYHPVDASAYPYATAAKEHLRSIDMDDVYRRQVEIVLAALIAEAATLPPT
jgi:AcrR family transcriptional regulator